MPCSTKHKKWNHFLDCGLNTLCLVHECMTSSSAPVVLYMAPIGSNKASGPTGVRAMRNTTVISVVSTKGGSRQNHHRRQFRRPGGNAGINVLLLIDADMQPSLTKVYKLAHARRSGPINEVISRGGLIKLRTSRHVSAWTSSPLQHGRPHQAWLKARRPPHHAQACGAPGIVRDNYDDRHHRHARRHGRVAAQWPLWRLTDAFTRCSPDMLNYAGLQRHAGDVAFLNVSGRLGCPR